MSPDAKPNHYVLVDYENVQAVDLDLIGSDAVRFILLLGSRQSKLDVGLVEKMITHASSVELLRLGESGRNALDFALAFHLGRVAATDPEGMFHIVSRDRDYDPLVRHLVGRRLNVRRHSDFIALGAAMRPGQPMAPTAHAAPARSYTPSYRSPVPSSRPPISVRPGISSRSAVSPRPVAPVPVAPPPPPPPALAPAVVPPPEPVAAVKPARTGRRTSSTRTKAAATPEPEPAPAPVGKVAKTSSAATSAAKVAKIPRTRSTRAAAAAKAAPTVEAAPPPPPAPPAPLLDSEMLHVLDHLREHASNRPRRIARFAPYLAASVYGHASNADIEKIIERLFAGRFIAADERGHMTYHL